MALRVERSLDRIPEALAAALGGELAVLAAALLGGAHAALHDGPSVAQLARVLPAPEDERPPEGIWTA